LLEVSAECNRRNILRGMDMNQELENAVDSRIDNYIGTYCVYYCVIAIIFWLF
jgi:hypothetical protein